MKEELDLNKIKDLDLGLNDNLDGDDKMFITDLVVMQKYGAKHSAGSSEYRCVQSCDICSLRASGAKNTEAERKLYENIFQEHDDDYSFSADKRKRIIKHMIHVFFEEQWKKGQEKMSKPDENLSNSTQKEISIGNKITPESTTEKQTAPVHNNIVQSDSKTESPDQTKLSLLQSSINQNDTETSFKNKESCTFKVPENNLIKAFKQELQLKKLVQEPIRSVDKSADKSERQICIKDVSLKVKKQGNGLLLSHLEENNLKSPEKTQKEEPIKHKEEHHLDKRPKTRPMEDKISPFYVNTEYFDIAVYEDGLANLQWNPTQVVYEMCSGCQWEAPVYDQVGYVIGEGFLFSVTVRGEKFTPRRRAPTKKTAKHLASVCFLHFVGFDFKFEVEQPPPPLPLPATFISNHAWAIGGSRRRPTTPSYIRYPRYY